MTEALKPSELFGLRWRSLGMSEVAPKSATKCGEIEV
jgi:hypothetical protein